MIVTFVKPILALLMWECPPQKSLPFWEYPKNKGLAGVVIEVITVSKRPL